MKTRIHNPVLLLFFILTSPAGFINAQEYDSVKTTVIEPGIVHKRIVSLKDTVIANILKIDLKRGNYYLKTVKANNNRLGRRKTTDIAAAQADSGYDVIAAVNADFFDMKTGEVKNNMITEGEFVKAVSAPGPAYDKFSKIHSQFAISYDNFPLIEKFFFKGELILRDRSVIKIHSINSSPDSNTVNVYNYLNGSSTPSLPDSWAFFEFEIKPLSASRDTALYITGDAFLTRGNNPVSRNALVVSANNSSAAGFSEKIKPGDTIKVIMKLLPESAPIRTLTGGRPKIVEKGNNIGEFADSLEGTAPGFSKLKHPRTGVGFNKERTDLYLIVADGRQETSRGMSLEAFARLMIKEGIYEGLNFDGGGSTTMVINGKIVNSPSDKAGERPVGNCLLLIRDKKTL